MKFARYIIFSSFILFMSVATHAQYDNPDTPAGPETGKREKKEINSKFFMSPRLGFSAWNDNAYFEIAPIGGYKFTSRFWLGAGPSYMFLKYGRDQTHIYGLTSFAYFAVLDKIDEVVNLGIGSIFVYLEDQVLSIKPYPEQRGWYNLILGGAGIRMPIGRGMGISIMALWGLNDASSMLYSNPEIRIMYDF